MCTAPQLNDTHRSEHDRQSDARFRVSISIVVPCFNEADGIENLRQRLSVWAETARTGLSWECILVDDGSRDGTGERISEIFGSDSRFQMIRHEVNGGLTKAMSTGFKSASGRWIACLDADCTYDPQVLNLLLHEAERGYDVVTASPYHRDGKVENVAVWRITLSRFASRIYRSLMRSQLSCYTCFVRIYDAERLKSCPDLVSPGFVGVTELLWRLDRAGARISEVPAILRPRASGVSKMRTFRTTLRHLHLMTRILLNRN